MYNTCPYSSNDCRVNPHNPTDNRGSGRSLGGNTWKVQTAETLSCHFKLHKSWRDCRPVYPGILRRGHWHQTFHPRQRNCLPGCFQFVFHLEWRLPLVNAGGSADRPALSPGCLHWLGTINLLIYGAAVEGRTKAQEVPNIKVPVNLKITIWLSIQIIHSEIYICKFLVFKAVYASQARWKFYIIFF